MPTIRFERLFALASRSARTVLARPDAPNMAVTTEADTPWYRYVSYRGNMPQVNVLVLIIPFKVVIGYSVLALAITGWGSLIDREFGRMAAIVGAH